MQDTLLMVFTGILAFAVFFQTFLFFGIYKSIRRMSSWMDGWGKDLLRNAEVVSSKVEEGVTTIRNVADSLKPITQNLVGTTQTVHNRIVELDNFLADATRTAQMEIARIQDVIQTASRRTEETIEILRESVLTPVSEISAIVRAIRVSLDVLFRRRRNPSNASAQDEEMFI
jgi:methyl-accepting chemotaxis protein